VDTNKIKKIRLTENLSEDELEDTIKNDNGTDHLEQLIKKVNQMAGSIEHAIGNEGSNVFNEAHLNNETNTSYVMINHNGIDNKDGKENFPNKNTINNDKENKINSTSTINNNCEIIRNSEETIENGKNESVENDITTNKTISHLNRSSSSDNLIIAENSDHEKENVAVDDDFSVTENISTAVDNSTVTESNLNNINTNQIEIENIVNSEQNNSELLLVLENDIQSITENTDETTKTMGSHQCNNNTEAHSEVDSHTNGSEQDFEVIDSDTNSDVSLSGSSNNLPDNIKDIVNEVKQMSKESFPQLLKLFNKKDVTFDVRIFYCF